MLSTEREGDQDWEILPLGPGSDSSQFQHNSCSHIYILQLPLVAMVLTCSLWWQEWRLSGMRYKWQVVNKYDTGSCVGGRGDRVMRHIVTLAHCWHFIQWLCHTHTQYHVTLMNCWHFTWWLYYTHGITWHIMTLDHCWHLTPSHTHKAYCDSKSLTTLYWVTLSLTWHNVTLTHCWHFTYTNTPV